MFRHALAWTLGFLFHCVTGSATAPNAAQVTVFAKTDTTQIRIGEQLHLTLTATAPPSQKLIFPVLPDTLHGLEVVKRNKIDTLPSENGKNIIYSQQVAITAFDSGYFVLEPLAFLAENLKDVPETLNTEAILISVKTIPVDTTQEIKDIKSTMDVPYTWKEILLIAIPVLVAILILGIIIYRIRRRQKLPKPEPRQVVLAVPPHVKALEALRLIEERKLWQQGQYKLYHSKVSDTLRAYIEARFGIMAMELPSDETLQRFRGTMIPEEAKTKLRSLLYLADMVKFAKVVPVGPENEQSMQDAYSFILFTKPAEASDFEKKEEKP